MTDVRFTASITVGLLLLFAAPALAQEQPSDDQLFMGKPYSVPDAVEVLSLTEEAREAVDEGAYERAALVLQKILDFHRSSVVMAGRREEERWVGARIWVHDYLRSLPEQGRRAYEAMAGPQARTMVMKAFAGRDTRLLGEARARFYLSGEGPEILRALARIHLTEGEFGDTAYHLTSLVRDFPASVVDKDRAVLAFALAKAKDRRGFERFLTGFPDTVTSDAEIVVGGERVKFREFLRPLNEEVEALPARPPGSETSWREFAGSASRSEPLPSLAKVGEGRWSLPTEYRYTNTDFRLNQYSGQNPHDLNRDHFPIHPVVDRGVAYFSNGYKLFAVNLYSGKLLWSHDGPISQSERRLNAQTVHSPAIRDGVIFTNLEVKVPIPEWNARTFQSRIVIFYIPQRRLFAIDTATRKMLWGHSDALVRDKEDRRLLEDINVNSPPLVVGDTVYAVVSRHTQRYFSYVLAVDARTGRVKWRTLICTGQQELNLFGRPIKELACAAVSERDGVLYCCTNLGVVSAVDRRTGEILWVKGYPLIPVPFAQMWHSTPERRPTWSNAAPVVTEDAVYFTPTDCRELVALNRKDGTVRFLFWGGDPHRDEEVFQHLLGAGPEYIYVSGPRVLAIHRRTGKVVWRLSQGSYRTRRRDGEAERALGRGFVTEDAVVAMTQRGLYFFDPKSGERRNHLPVEFGGKPAGGGIQAGGNLVRAGNVLLVSQRDRIGAFYEWKSIHKEFRERLRKDPENAHLALEAGEVFLQGGDADEAVEAFRRAIDKAEKLPRDERRKVELVARKGLFDLHIMEGDRLWEKGELGSAAKSFREARKAAPDPESEIRAILSLADYERRSGSKSKLRKLYVELADSLGDTLYEFPSLGTVSSGLYALISLAEMALDNGRAAEAVGHLSRIIAEFPGEAILSASESQIYARDRIARILEEEGRAAYKPFEERAKGLLAEARRSDSERRFLEIIRLYPNSRTVDDAAVELGRLLLAKQDWRQASLALRRILSEFPDSPKAPVLLYLLSTALERRGYLFSAKSALMRLSRMDPSIKVEEGGRTRALAAVARRRLEEPQFKDLKTETREVQPPLELLWAADEGETSYVRILETKGITPPGAERILYLGTNGVLRAVDSHTEDLLWQREMNGILTRLIYAGGRLVLINNNMISGADPARGEPIWEIPNDAQVRAVGLNPTSVFVLTAETRQPKNLQLRAIDPRSGDVIWSKQLEDHEAYDLLLVTEEAVGIASRDPARVIMFDAATGRLRFRVDMTPRSLYRAPFLVDGDKLLVVHGTRRFELIDVGTGQQIWEMSFPGEQFFRTVMPVAEGIFLADTEETLILLDAVDGSVRWKVPAIEDAPIQPRGEAADLEKVYLVRRRQEDGLHYAEARDLRTGELVWRADLLVSRSADPAPILADRHIIYNVNSYDFGRTAWSSASVFIDKETGKVRQVIKPETLEGLYTYGYLRNGVYGLGARGRVAFYGPR